MPQEFVEMYVMEQAKTGGAKSREEKWKTFFDDESGPGPQVLTCIKSKNPTWKSSAFVATRLSQMYASASDHHHATAHSINSNKTHSVDIAGVQQTLDVIMCIGETLQINTQIVKE